MQLPSPLSAGSEVARGRGVGVDDETDFLDVGDGRDGREVWKDRRRDQQLRREEYIRRGVERLCVGDQENEKETDDPLAEADDDDDGDNDVECGEGGVGHASPSLQSDMAGKGGKSKPFGRNARPQAKKGQGKGSDGDGDGDGAHIRPDETAGMEMAIVVQRLKNVGVDRDAEKCGKKWDNLMQQFKKVHHFQSPSGGADFFQLSSKERASRGFNFTMDRAVYDEIEGSTGMKHTIHPKNVADTGASGGVRPPSTSYADPESVSDGEGGAGREDDDDGSTQGSSQTTGTPGGFGKRKSTRQQTFEALTECMEKHGALMASTMESSSKRECSVDDGELIDHNRRGQSSLMRTPRMPAADATRRETRRRRRTLTRCDGRRTRKKEEEEGGGRRRKKEEEGGGRRRRKKEEEGGRRRRKKEGGGGGGRGMKEDEEEGMDGEMGWWDGWRDGMVGWMARCDRRRRRKKGEEEEGGGRRKKKGEEEEGGRRRRKKEGRKEEEEEEEGKRRKKEEEEGGRRRKKGWMARWDGGRGGEMGCEIRWKRKEEEGGGKRRSKKEEEGGGGRRRKKKKEEEGGMRRTKKEEGGGGRRGGWRDGMMGWVARWDGGMDGGMQ
ncbi:hypothetical protein CBR_g52085 [Chara braunii]|uniref:Myb-like domain-containing protein n=1 Tax=Chara braunii TaxID=69332 RepID=A0A388M9P2_CHABU|nr:hypothetical protein CBR_g52085 [Chara braunii]|eukprot:GBG91203.1 hypothetical protein CBR_g52085 [Chara braunii]